MSNAETLRRIRCDIENVERRLLELPIPLGTSRIAVERAVQELGRARAGLNYAVAHGVDPIIEHVAA